MKPLFEPDTVVPTATASPFKTPAVQPAIRPVSAPVPVAAPAPSLRTAPMPVPLTDMELEALGSKATAGLAKLPDQLMTVIRASDAGEFGSDLNRLVALAKGLDPESVNGKGLLSRARNMFSSAKERLLAQYNSVEKQMDSLVAEMDKKAALHRQRVKELDQLYDANVAYHQGIEDAVAKASQVLAETQARLAAAGNAGDAFEAQQVSDLQRFAERVEKRIDDWKRAMLLAKQTAPQIRMMQDNARGLVEKFGDVKDVTVPAWKNAFSLYLLHMEQKQAVDVVNSVDEATDAALRRGATLLRQNTEDIARARQRSVVSLETLQFVQGELIGSVDAVQRINDEARAARKAAEPALLALENELITRFAPGQR